MGIKFYLEASVTGVKGVWNNAWAEFHDKYGDIEIDNIKVVMIDE